MPSPTYPKKAFKMQFLPSRSCLIQATNIVKDFKQLTALQVDG